MLAASFKPGSISLVAGEIPAFSSRVRAPGRRERKPSQILDARRLQRRLAQPSRRSRSVARRLPRLETIEAFLEAARAPSFRVAAERCALSPAAFSRRIQAFARFAGDEVFERGPAGMQLTAAGQRMLARLEPGYLAMRKAASDLVAPRGSTAITVSLSHSLAVGWLIPSLPDFSARHPNVEVRFITDRSPASLRRGEADLAVCTSDADVSGLEAIPILDTTVSPVASPDLARTIASTGASIGAIGVLNMRQHPELWPWWCGETGHPLSAFRTVATFDTQHAMYEAAAAGAGVAAGIDVTVARHLEAGRLVSLGLPAARYPGAYLLISASARRPPSVEAFWRWMRDQAASRSFHWSDHGLPPAQAGASRAPITRSARR
jgi:LysR family glycine cleavage system transcriptional activator